MDGAIETLILSRFLAWLKVLECLGSHQCPSMTWQAACSSEEKQCRVPAALGVAAVCRQGQVNHQITSKLCRPGVGTGQVTVR